MAEVYAGFSEYTDAQVGRIIDHLEESGQLDNTLVIYCADNGASGEGTPNGSVNEGKLFGGFPDDLKQNLSMIDQLGSPDTYNHYPTGWATAFSTPYRMFKRYTYQGGVCDPLVIHWPAGITAHGEVRHQYHHSTDIVATIFDVCGVELPATYNGVDQRPLDGVSMRYSFDAAADGATEKHTQYYEMLGSRGIWHDGWKAVTEHGATSGMSHFDDDRWQLFHTDIDRSEAHDVAEGNPEKVAELTKLWMEEAKRNFVLPLNDLQILGSPKDLETFIGMEFKIPVPPTGTYTYFPGTTEIPERSAANTHGVSYKILAEVRTTADTEGVIFAQGSRFGGHSLFIKDGRITYSYNFLGIPPEDLISAPVSAPGPRVFGVEFTKERMGEHHEGIGPLKLYIDDEQVAEQEIRTILGHFSLCGEGLCIGYDSGDAVSKEYEGSRFEYTGGEIVKVVFDIADDLYVDVETHLAAAMARD
jgi:arylsulfatase